MGQNPKADGSNYIPPTSGGAILPRMMQARRLWAYGSQLDYFDDPHCIGFARSGHPARSGGAGLAVLMTNAWEYKKKVMCVGKRHAGERWTDLLKWCPGTVTIDSNGFGTFSVGPRSVSVWVSEDAERRRAVDAFVL
jgi:alpha-amylase